MRGLAADLWEASLFRARSSHLRDSVLAGRDVRPPPKRVRTPVILPEGKWDPVWRDRLVRGEIFWRKGKSLDRPWRKAMAGGQCFALIREERTGCVVRVRGFEWLVDELVADSLVQTYRASRVFERAWDARMAVELLFWRSKESLEKSAA